MKTAFAIAAHPDDIEFVMSGTMMRLREVGYQLHYMNLADGCCGSSEHDAAETARLRLQEAKQAARYLGAVFHDPLVRDIEVFYDRATLGRLTSVIRDVAPRIILTHSPQDYMEDHTNTSRLVVTSAFCRGMPNFAVDPPRPAQDQPVVVYHAQPHGNCDGFGQPIWPDSVVDVTQLMQRKVDMLRLHRSQQQWLDRTQGMGSYTQAMQQLLAQVGQHADPPLRYAEGWRRHMHLGLCGPQDNPLAEVARPFQQRSA